MRLARLSVALAFVSSGCGTAPLGDGDELPRTCVSPRADRAGTATLQDDLGTAHVEVEDTGPCTRLYTLTSTAPRRDNFPAGAREVIDHAGLPSLRTGNDLFDALHALALDEVRESSVETIQDGAFAGGLPLPCPEGGCFETGRLWTYVWTRDTSYSVDLGLAGIDPRRAKNSLEFKLSAPREGGEEQIVQDTGTGGSYPVSSDRVVWALGAGALLPHLDGDEREAFEARAYAALRATIEHDRQVVFDAVDGLYTGEQSFLDWREQSYPAWTADDVAPIASSKALGTNVVHLRALELAAELAGARGDVADASRYEGWAGALKGRIRERFWLEDAGLFSTFATTFLDPAPARQFDLLGSALVVLSGVASPDQAARVVASYPHVGPGAAPVIFPQQQRTAIYHNRAEWPFVTAYWARAAAAVDHPAAATTAMRSLVRAAALNLSNMENLEIATGAPFVDDGPYSGPVVNSHRQLWSVAGYLSMVHHTLFGLRFGDDGLVVAPYVPRALREDLFAGTDSLVLNDVPWRGKTITVVLHLPARAGSDGSYELGAVRLNGELVEGPIPHAALEPASRIDVELVDPAAPRSPALTRRDPASWRELFAPRVPAISRVRRAGAALAVELSAGGEDAGTIRYAIYRDGTRVAADVAGSATSFTDTTADPSTTACYAVETCFTETGNCSQRSRPICWWGDQEERVTHVPASAFVATGGVGSTLYGRFHYERWGDPGHTLVVPSLRPTRTGPHLVQLVYGNGAGPINTGITCAIKRVTIRDAETDAVVASGPVTMPHLGTWARWADSTFLRAELDATRTYRVTIDSAPITRNKSAFAHFARYVGLGGETGEFAHVNIAELKLLAR